MTLAERTAARQRATAALPPAYPPGPRRWGALATIAVSIATAAIYWPDVALLWARWSEAGPSNLVLFVGPLLPWLIWRQRAAIRFDAQPPLARAAATLAALGLGWAFASSAHVDIVRQALLPAIAWAAIWGLIGASAARAALFPLAWTGCAVMVWEWLTPALQLATATATPVLVRMVGIPAHIEGNIVSIPAGTFEVAAGCSGLNFFLVAVTLAVLYGHLREWGIPRRIAFIALAMATAIAFNWLRVAIIVSVGQFSDMQSPLVFHHVLFGWLLYAVALVGLFLAAARWGPSGGAAQRPVPIGQAVAQPRSATIRAAIVLGLLAMPPLLAGLQEARVDRALAGTGVALPAATGGWDGPVDGPFDWRPLYPGASAIARGTYRKQGASIGVDVSYFSRQQSGMKLIASTAQPGGGEDWRVVDASVVAQRAVDGGPRAVRQLHVHGVHGVDWVVWQWYQVGTTATPSVLRAKLQEGMRALGATSASASVSVAYRCRAECADGEVPAVLAGFLAANGAALAKAARGQPLASGRTVERHDDR